MLKTSQIMSFEDRSLLQLNSRDGDSFVVCGCLQYIGRVRSFLLSIKAGMWFYAVELMENRRKSGRYEKRSKLCDLREVVAKAEGT